MLEVQNIPKSFHAADLRVFFSTWVEQGRFEMFHFKHRGSDQPRPSCSCLVKLKEPHEPEFLRIFNNKKWTDRNGEYEGDVCIVVQCENHTSPRPSAYSSRKELTKIVNHRARESELFSPPGLPNGSVGTPSQVVRSHAHELPAELLQRLGIEKLPPNSEFQYEYPSSRKKRKPTKSNDSSWIEWPEEEEEESTQCVSDPEEWDRHMWYHPVLDEDRMLGLQGEEKPFEWEISNPWDKQEASGLVWYTDTLYWDKKKGDFDERTTDEWDVEVNERPEDKFGERGKRRWQGQQNPRRKQQQAEHFRFQNGLVASRTSRQSSLVAAARNKLIQQFGQTQNAQEGQGNEDDKKEGEEKRDRGLPTTILLPPAEGWQQGVAGNMLRRMGWTEGSGLGKQEQGLRTPIAAVPRVERRGLGFTRGVKFSGAQVEVLPLAADDRKLSTRHFAQLRASGQKEHRANGQEELRASGQEEQQLKTTP